MKQECWSDKRHLINFGALSFIIALLSGCGTIQAQSRVDPQTIAVYPPGKGISDGKSGDADLRCPTKLKGDTRGGAINLDCFRFPEDSKDGDTAYKKAAEKKDGAVSRLAAILLKQSDDVCTLELGRLTANEATVNTALSVLTTGLSATASIVNGDTAKSILSGLATTSNATRGHINAEIYRNSLSPVIARAIQGERKQLKPIILQAVTTNSYSVDRMILAVNEYHQICSFYYGLGLVVKAVDRVAFEQGDPKRSASLSLEDVNLRIENIEQAFAKPGLLPEVKVELLKQCPELKALQTKLLVKHSGMEPVAAAAP